MLMRNHQESQLLLVKEGDIYNKNLKKGKYYGSFLISFSFHMYFNKQNILIKSYQCLFLLMKKYNYL